MGQWFEWLYFYLVLELLEYTEKINNNNVMSWWVDTWFSSAPENL